ncbi:MAG: hypothetical protein ACLQOO_25445 [Terriglobia bacterium]
MKGRPRNVANVAENGHATAPQPTSPRVLQKHHGKRAILFRFASSGFFAAWCGSRLILHVFSRARPVG